MNEISKYEEQKKRMQGLCDEHGLVFKMCKTNYPITLTLRPAKDLASQIDMLEDAEEAGYRSPDAVMTLIYPGRDDSQLETVFNGGTFTISDTLRGKIQSTFMKMCFFYHQFFFRDVVEKGLLKSGMPPVISEDEAEDEVDEIDEADIPEDEIENLPPIEDDNPDVAEATKIVRAENKATLSLLQRRMNIGYAKAARLLNKLEDLGVVGEYNGPNSREVLPYDVPEDENEEDTNNG